MTKNISPEKCTNPYDFLSFNPTGWFSAQSRYHQESPLSSLVKVKRSGVVGVPHGPVIIRKFYIVLTN